MGFEPTPLRFLSDALPSELICKQTFRVNSPVFVIFKEPVLLIFYLSVSG